MRFVSSIVMDSRTKTTYKLHKKPKIPKLLKKLPKSIFKAFKKAFETVFPPSSPPPLLPLRQDGHDPFMACMIKVDSSKKGWHKCVSRVVAKYNGATRFRMGPDGHVMVSGIGDPEALLKRLGRTRKAKLVQFQYGHCCKNMFLPPEPTPKTAGPPQQNQGYGFNPHSRHLPPPQMGYANPYYRQLPAVQQGYGYNPRYQQPQYSAYGYQPRRYLPSNN